LSVSFVVMCCGRCGGCCWFSIHSSQAPNENAQRAVLASCAGPVRGRQPSFVFSSSSPCCPCPSKNNLVLVLPRDASWLDHMRSMPNAGYRSATNERLMRAESCATATSRWHAAPSGALLRGGIPGNEGPRAMRAQVNSVRERFGPRLLLHVPELAYMFNWCPSGTVFTISL